ncbi:MAG: acyl-CoA dehydrogenase family protein [Thermodesulfobacteriota bacterium]|nr:acyl-CoA dehydrogenase family protein [Thermodesulfobacteriota bacterium]
MNLDFNEDQEILRSSAKSFAEKECPKDTVRKIEESEEGYSPDIWKKMAELGWMGIAFPEEYGGYGGDFMNLIVLMEEIGRNILPSPFFSTVVLSGLTILEGGTEEQKTEYLSKIAAGEIIMALALYESNTSYNASGITVTASSKDDGYVINGTKLFVADANIADCLLVATRTEETANPEEGVTLFFVDAKASGITCTKMPTMGADNMCEVILDNVTVSKDAVLGNAGNGWDVLKKSSEKAIMAKCAEMVGGMEASLEMTNAYAKERVQYGNPIGKYQAIQHFLANMWIKVDTSKNILYEASWMVGENIPCSKKVSAAKNWINEGYKFVTERGIQIHGGIGTTREGDIGLYYRRAKAAELMLGDTNHHLEQVAKEMGL